MSTLDDLLDFYERPCVLRGCVENVRFRTQRRRWSGRGPVHDVDTDGAGDDRFDVIRGGDAEAVGEATCGQRDC